MLFLNGLCIFSIIFEIKYCKFLFRIMLLGEDSEANMILFYYIWLNQGRIQDFGKGGGGGG